MEQFIPYEKLWERDKVWLTGRYILGSIVGHAYDQNRCLEVNSEKASEGELSITIPSPKVFDMVSKQMKPLWHSVPEELLSVFQERVQLVIDLRTNKLQALANKYQYQRLTPMTLAQLATDLCDIENERRAYGSPSLSDDLAHAFGLREEFRYADRIKAYPGNFRPR